MKAQNTLTFIISKNFGHPISLSCPVWRFYVGVAIAATLLTAMLAMSILFLATYPRTLNIERERDQYRKERNALRDQLTSANQRLLELKEERYLAAKKENQAGGEPPARSFGSVVSASDYLPPVQISSASTRVSRKHVEVIFRITNQGEAVRNRGGFLFAVFENLDLEPTRFAVSPKVKLNVEGFPETYKAGVRFPRVRKPVTYRRKVRRKNAEDYFTNVTLYLFSLRGGLLVKERFELDRDLFLQGNSTQATQELLRL